MAPERSDVEVRIDPETGEVAGVPVQPQPDLHALLERSSQNAERLRVNRMQARATILIAALGMLTILYVAKLVLLVLMISVLLAFVLAPVVELFEQLRLPRALAAMSAMFVLFLGLTWLGNASFNQGVNFYRDMPKYSGKIRAALGKLRKHAREFQESTNVLPEEGQAPPTVQVQQQTSWGDMVTETLGPVTEVLLLASFVPFLSFFMLTWQEHVRSATVMLFRMEHRHTAYTTLGLISRMMRTFIVANLLMGLMIGGISTIIFGLLHLPYFYFIGFISGFLSMVPYLGVVLGMFPPLLAALGHLHAYEGIVICSTVIGLHFFCFNVLYPKFLGSRLQLNPLSVTLALLFWGWLWGAVGLVLAVPMTAAMKIIFDHVDTLRAYGAWLGE